MTSKKTPLRLTARGEMVADILGGIGLLVALAAFVFAVLVR